MKQVVLLIGSLSQNSLNRKIAQCVVDALSDVQVTESHIADLPLYTQDLDNQNIKSYARLRDEIANADAVLIVSPEHNRSIPAALKNAIDIATRPTGHNLWQGKKVAIITASPSNYGGMPAGLELRKVMHAVGATTFAREVYLSQAHKAIDEHDRVGDERTRSFLSRFAAEFESFCLS